MARVENGFAGRRDDRRPGHTTICFLFHALPRHRSATKSASSANEATLMLSLTALGASHTSIYLWRPATISTLAAIVCIFYFFGAACLPLLLSLTLSPHMPYVSHT